MPSALYDQLDQVHAWLMVGGGSMMIGAALLALRLVLDKPRTPAQKQTAYEKSRRDWRKVHPIISTEDKDR